MIVTVTLNPALDKTVVIPDFRAGQVNRVASSRVDPGGKGVNVSKVLMSLGEASIAAGLCGGHAGRQLLDGLERLGIPTAFEYGPAETRTNLKITTGPGGETTDVNEPGAPVTPQQLQALEARLDALTGLGDMIVLAGSLPPGVPADYYAGLTRRQHMRGVRVAVDTSGAPLRQAALAAPDLLKPNLEELEQLTGNHPESDAAILDACRPLLARGTALVAVTLGGEGAVLVSRGGAWRAQALPVTVQSTVGSGDAFTAALALGLQRGMETEQLLALAAAAGAVNAMTGGTDVPDGAQIRAMAVRAQLRRLA